LASVGAWTRAIRAKPLFIPCTKKAVLIDLVAQSVRSVRFQTQDT
jgi:hypothetical protein